MLIYLYQRAGKILFEHPRQDKRWSRVWLRKISRFINVVKETGANNESFFEYLSKLIESKSPLAKDVKIRSYVKNVYSQFKICHVNSIIVFMIHYTSIIADDCESICKFII